MARSASARQSSRVSAISCVKELLPRTPSKKLSEYAHPGFLRNAKRTLKGDPKPWDRDVGGGELRYLKRCDDGVYELHLVSTVGGKGDATSRTRTRAICVKGISERRDWVLSNFVKHAAPPSAVFPFFVKPPIGTHVRAQALSTACRTAQ